MDDMSMNVVDPTARYPLCFIIPTYNRSPALMECLGHLERQTFSDFEVIVVDDGSTDSTSRDMEGYLAKTPLRIRYLRQSNSGPAKARNLGISKAQSTLCLMIGDDIMASPGFAEAHLQFHRENADLNIAALGLTRWSETGQTVTPLMHWLDKSGVQFAYQDLLQGTKPDWKYFYTSNLSVKTELLRLHPFDERFTKDYWMMEDGELGYRLERLCGLKLVFIPQAYAEHIHPTNFRKSCKRAYGAGLSAKMFDQLWPDRPVSRHGVLHRMVREMLCRNAWLLQPVTRLTEIVTKVWCPNPLLRPLLAYHNALGYRDPRVPRA